MAEKRISFSGIDTGVTSMMAKLRQSSKELGSDMISDARKYSQQAKEQLSFLEEQIRALEKRNRLEKESMEMQARSQYKGDALKVKLGEISSASSQDDMQIKLLRELIDTIKLTSKEEIAEDRKSVEQQIRQFQKAPGSFSPEEQLKLAYQEDLLAPEKKKGRGSMGDVFMGTFLANTLSNALSKISSMAGAREGDQALLSLGSAIPFIGELIGATGGRALQEQLSYGQSRGRFRAGTGRRIGTLGRYNQFGLTGTESQDLLLGGFQAAGGDVDRSDFLASTRIIGQGNAEQILRTGRMSGGQNIERLLGRQLAIMEEQGIDRSLLNENLQNQLQLTSQLQAVNPYFDAGTSQNIFGQFGQIGGAFSANNPQFSNYISTIQQNLSNPQNDLMRAENISVLRRLNPNASPFELMAMEEEGLGTEGFGQGVFQRILDRFGTGDAAKFALKQRTGLSYGVVQDIFEKGDLEAFTKGDLSFDDLVKPFDVGREARASTADRDVKAAMVTDEFAGNMGALSGTTEILSQSFETLTEKVKNFDFTFSDAADKIDRWVYEKTGWDWLKPKEPEN